MNEQNPASHEATIAELQERINELTNVNAFLQGGIESWAKRFATMKAEVQAFADDELLDDDTDAVAIWLLNEFDIELTEEVDVIVTVTYSGTMTVEKGTDVEGLEVFTDLPWNLSFIGNVDSNVNYDDVSISRN